MFLFLLSLLGTSSASAKSPYDVPKAEWDVLNSTVGGRLAYGVPLARACFAQAGGNVTTGGSSCATVQANYGSDLFRVTQFGTAMKTQWETCQKSNQGCLLDSNNPSNTSAFSPPKKCDQGSIPPYYIAVKNADDVTQSFAFSARTGVPLSIKNTGHDYNGKSLAPGTLSLWTHNIKYINYSTSFAPSRCAATGVPALTYGAGQDFESLYSFAESHNITLIGGSAKTVGAAGGWLMGGGHSVLSNTYGLGVDRVLQFRVVTPDGRSRIANRCENADLFWALRGGGGGTFGVVMEVTSEVVPHPVSTVSLGWQLEPTAANIAGLMKVVVANSVEWSRAGWGGYIYPTAGILANPKLDAAAAAQSLKPLTDFLNSTGASKSQWSRYPSYLPLFTAINKYPIAAGVNGAVASRLVPQSLFTPYNQEALYNATMRALTVPGGRLGLFFTTPFSFHSQPGSTSVTPAWREAVWHVVSATQWPWDASTEQARRSFRDASDSVQALRALTPNGGAYLNEADAYEPDTSNSFWGSENYARLLEVKKKYDSQGLLDCWHCVGWKGSATKIASCYL